MKKIILVIVLMIIISCNNRDVTLVSTNKPTVDSTIVSKEQLQTDIITKTDSTNTDLLKLINKFCETDFRESRKQLVAESKEQNYQISEIVSIGNSLKYDVVIPEIEGNIEYTCTPQNGELTIIMIGDNAIVQMSYKQSKISKKWDNCNENDGDEKCETYEEWETKPLKNHFTISLVH